MNKKDLAFVGVQFFLFVIYFVPLVDYAFRVNASVKYPAFFLTVAGLLIVAIAFRQMNKSLTPLPTPRANARLIQTGLYKYARHPIYSGLIMASLGFGVYWESAWKSLIGLLLWILFYFKSAYEEKLLAVRFAEYNVYRQNTFRFFPFL